MINLVPVEEPWRLCDALAFSNAAEVFLNPNQAPIPLGYRSKRIAYASVLSLFIEILNAGVNDATLRIYTQMMKADGTWFPLTAGIVASSQTLSTSLAASYRIVRAISALSAGPGGYVFSVQGAAADAMTVTAWVQRFSQGMPNEI